MHNDNWDDLRFVLAVAETGSVSAAARDLGVNHATVLRRVTAFEEAHGAEIFERLQQGYRLRPDRAHVIEAARQAARALGRVSHLLRANGSGSGDLLRLTSTDTLCTTWLAAGIGRIMTEMAPHRVCLISSNSHLDMVRMQADLALRPAETKPPDMAGRRVASLQVAAYARERSETRWLGLSGPLGRSIPARWMAENIAPHAIGASADSFLTLAEMARAGQGIAILPHPVAFDDPGLVRLDLAMPVINIPVWLLCHPDLANTDRMQRFMSVVEAVVRDPDRKISTAPALARSTAARQ